ncbi:RhoGAP-domain-containing protein [Auriculariales sp. MPI-PUGE-AT-0066]|nr:RhoGAP-domain-containing protein [Auriculariales sp. MPI-PUGE-AT-0066]
MASSPEPQDSVEAAVETSFDESVLRALCDLDCGVPLLLDRIKQGMVSCREAALFFKKRAVFEEEYGRNLQKLARTTVEQYALGDGKAGSFVHAWSTSLRIHDLMAENRLKFAQRLSEMSDDLSTLAKEVDKTRKQTKDVAARYERTLQESELVTERARTRFDMTAEELERVLLAKQGENMSDTGAMQRMPQKRALGTAVKKGGMLLKGKNFNNISRQEDDVRTRMSTTSDVYRKAVLETQTVRQEYFNFQLPRILRALKESSDELDKGLQYHLGRYAFLFESIVLNDGTTLSPMGVEDGPGLRPTFQAIDNRNDFRSYMQNYAVAYTGPRGPRRDGPADEGFVNPRPQLVLSSSGSSSTAFHNHTQSNASSPMPRSATSMMGPDRAQWGTFGVDLEEQMKRDAVEVPRILDRCAAAVERHGLTSTGIYRLVGGQGKVTKLKALLDQNVEAVNLDDEEWTADINVIASVLKMWLRELPDPVIKFCEAAGFLEAARIENDRLRHIRLHERINELPDANYATLKFIMGHLYRISQNETVNQMSMSNLSIVFGPTLFGFQTVPTPNMALPPGTNGMDAAQKAVGVPDTAAQNRAIETILEHYTDIFVEEDDDDE